MATFKYTLPSGAEFELEAPAGTTQAQADFAFYSQKIPVCFFRLGTGFSEGRENYSVHHPNFDVDMECLKTGVLSMILAAFTK